MNINSENHNSVGGVIPDPSQAVDLGLPSGAKWAPWNVGASRPSEPGGYFAWGETTADKRNANGEPWYYWDNYKFISDRSGDPDDMWMRINKYQIDDGQDGTYICYGFIFNRNGKKSFEHADDAATADWFDLVFVADGKTTLVSEDDAATANWGRQWKMPTLEQFHEILDPENCSWDWKNRTNGTASYVITSVRNGNCLFIPATGCRLKADLDRIGFRGFYWSSDLCEGNIRNAWGLSFCPTFRSFFDNGRCFGMPVRPVLVAAE